jgi:hypothetical protein
MAPPPDQAIKHIPENADIIARNGFESLRVEDAGANVLKIIVPRGKVADSVAGLDRRSGVAALTP